MKVPRIIMAAPKSGSGKTVITISLMNALKKQGKKVSAFKCGPDFIDPMYHKKVLDIDSRNLDLFFTDEETTRGIFLHDNECDISIIEGVMGLYDGIGGISEEASTYHLAKTLKAPIVLVMDTKGMSRSVLAEVAGFISMDKEKLIKGIILNNMSSGIYEEIKKLIEGKFSIPVLGYFPHQKECDITSRYLGLAMPDEISDLKKKIDAASDEFIKNINLKKLMDIAEKAEDIKSNFTFPKRQKYSTRIAVAFDQAFNFYYRDNLELLKTLGAEFVYFSPLNDSELPDNIDGLLIGGGYPELYAEKLSQNKSMLASVKKEIEEGLPVWAECGGFIYLHENISVDGNNFRLCGIIKGECSQRSRLVRFGYMKLNEIDVKGHEFHYFDSDMNGDLCIAEKPLSKKQWTCGHNINGGFQGFPHLYYLSNIEYAEKIVDTCRKYRGMQ